jgi:hypothetical protein
VGNAACTSCSALATTAGAGSTEALACFCAAGAFGGCFQTCLLTDSASHRLFWFLPCRHRRRLVFVVPRRPVAEPDRGHGVQRVSPVHRFRRRKHLCAAVPLVSGVGGLATSQCCVHCPGGVAQPCRILGPQRRSVNPHHNSSSFTTFWHVLFFCGAQAPVRASSAAPARGRARWAPARASSARPTANPASSEPPRLCRAHARPVRVRLECLMKVHAAG